MEQQQVSKDVFSEKYAKGQEQTHEEVFMRVAKGLALCEEEQEREQYQNLFFENMKKGAVGAGRIMSAAGTGIAATLANCFVQPVGDSIRGVDEDGLPGIYPALEMAAETMRRGGGVGYNFTPIRPMHAWVNSTMSKASGPCSYIDLFDASCRTVESAGSRRGAQMGILNIDHPDIFEFVRAKRTVGRWNNFNVSVGLIDGFMECLQADGNWELVHKAKPAEHLIDKGAFKRADGKWVYQVIRAKDLWDVIMQSTYDYAEPGIVNLVNMNNDNNLRKKETMRATNPCGEQPLPDYGCCDLGPIWLAKFVEMPFTSAASFNFPKFKEAVRTQVRMLDNVLNVTMWPLVEQNKEAMNKRRIGVGFTGFGNMLTMLGLLYNSKAGLDFGALVAAEMRNAAYRASVDLAIERGSFPLFDADEYLEEGTFASRLPDDIKADIRKYGIRNSHLLSIAPVGTISLAFFDNTSNGIEPAFSWSYLRKKRIANDEVQVYAVEDHAFRIYCQHALEEGIHSEASIMAVREAVAQGRAKFKYGDNEMSVRDFLPKSFVSALEMSALDHLYMMAAVQPYIDSAISKTVNIPADYPFEDFKDLYLKAHEYGLKGLATYRPNATLGAVLSVPTETVTEEKEVEQPVVDIDPVKVVIERRPSGVLPAVTEKIEYYTTEGKKSLYVVVSFVPVNGIHEGKSVVIQRPIEFFLPAGQEGEAQQWVTAAMRSLSLAARGGFVARALRDMRQVSWDRGPVRYGKRVRLDGQECGMTHESEVAAIAFALQQILFNYNYLDLDGNQIPVNAIVKLQNMKPEANVIVAKPAVETPSLMHSYGKKCTECGEKAVVPRDGCEICDACGNVGSCG